MDHQLTPAQMVDVLREERQRRWAKGDRVPAEEFLQRYPELLAEPERVLELVYHEKLLREELGETPRLEEYTERFPQFAAQLRALFEVDSWLDKPEAERSAPSSTDLSAAATPPVWEDPAGGAWPTVPSYEILEHLGRGGMGVVYKARHERLNRIVALKMIRAGAQADAAELERFRAEAETQARLQHPHIVQIYEVGEVDGCPYLALEYVDGGSLDKHLAGQPMPALQAAQLAETLARAVDYAHQRGLVHRDLKPANVLLTAAGTPKITDFGLAKRLESAAGQTQSGAVLGTPSYMAPEQADGQTRTAGPAADVYALGVILYEMLTGRLPFVAESLLDTLVQKTTLDPVPPSRFQPAVPRALEILVLKCLQREPERRFQSAAELADELRRYLHDEPIQTQAVGRMERFTLWCRRNPVRAALSTALALAGMAVVLLGMVALGHKRQADQFAQRLREIDATRHTLQEKLEEAKQRDNPLSHDVSQIAGGATGPGLQSPEISLLTEKLKSLLTDFKAQTSSTPLPEAVDLQIRLAEATVANAEQRYAQALEMITEDDIRAAQEATETRLEQEVKANQTRGEAFFGLNQSASALKHYQRILQLRPADWTARRNAGICLIRLRQPDPAIAEFTTLVNEFRRQVEQEGRQDLATHLAESLTNRGNAYDFQGKLAESSADHDQAVQIYAGLAEREGKPGLTNQFASSLDNRGIVRLAQKRYTEAIADFDQAIVLRTRLVERENHREYAHYLVRDLSNRGITFMNQSQWPKAVADLDRAVAIATRLVEQENHREFTDSLARTLLNRGIALGKQKRSTEALADLTKALQLVTDLVERERRPELVFEVAACLASRGGVRRGLGQLPGAVADFTEAIALQIRLIDREGNHPDLANKLASSLDDRGMAFFAQRRFAEAVADHEQAVAILSRLVETEGRREFRSDLARTLSNCGIARRSHGQLSRAIADLDKAMAILSQLIEGEGQNHLSFPLAAALANHGLCMESQGELSAALADQEKAVGIFTRLINEEGRQELKGNLALCLKWRDRVKDAFRAVDDLEFALTRPPAEAAKLLSIRVAVCLRAGRHAEAALTTAKLHELAPRNPLSLYDTACNYALCAAAVAAGKAHDQLTPDELATRSQYQRQALEALTQAIDHGFKDLAHIEADSDLVSIRQEPAYRALVERLKKRP